MHLITGDETGLVRLISTEKKDFVTYGETQSRTLSVLSMAWLVYDEIFALLRVNGHIETYEINLEDPENGSLELIGTYTSGVESPMKITRLNDHSVLCYNTKGTVDIVSVSEKSNCLDTAVSMFNKDASLRGPVGVVEYNSMSSRLACGGQKNDLQVWDIVTKQLVWKAKNVPHDEVRLEVPIWITGIAFIPTGASDVTAPSDCTGNIIATGTCHKHIRLYDTRMQRQPCQSWGTGDFRVTNVVPSYQHEQHVYVTDCAGGVLMYDMRNGRRIRTLDGFDGSIRDIAHESNGGSHMAAVSLDRYVKVYDCRKNKQVFQAYLKNRLNCTLLLGADDNESNDDNDDGSYNSADDDSADDDVIEEFVDSSSDSDSGSDEDDDGDDEEDEKDNSYADIEPTGGHKQKQKFTYSSSSKNKKQKKR